MGERSEGIARTERTEPRERVTEISQDGRAVRLSGRILEEFKSRLGRRWGGLDKKKQDAVSERSAAVADHVIAQLEGETGAELTGEDLPEELRGIFRDSVCSVGQEALKGTMIALGARY